MKNKIIILLIFVFLATPAFGASKMLKKAMKAYESRDYLQSATILIENVDNFSGKEKDVANLYLGIINTKNAEFHKSLYSASLESNKVYLERLSKEKGKKHSKYAKLFLGEVYLNQGQYKSAIKTLKDFAKGKGIDKDIKKIAKVLIGQAQYLSGNKKSASQYWDKVGKAPFTVKLALLSAKERSGAKVKYNLDNIYKEYQKQAKSKTGISGRDISNMLLLLSKSDISVKGLEILTSTDIDTPSFRESFKGGKQIAFYDVSLLESSYKLLQTLGKKYLALAASSNKYAPTAAIYQIDAGIIFKDTKQISDASTVLASDSGLPKALSKLRPVKLNAGDYVAGKKKEANSTRESIVNKNGSDPNVFGEVLHMCAYTQANCDSVVDKAKLLSSKTQGRRYAPLNKGIGHYLLSQNKSTDAITYLELARDKSNKNKLSANDPILLVNLAKAYRMDSVYLETLEILFEMNRYYPAVRQIQEAIQGTYAMHQKSAGDVKIF